MTIVHAIALFVAALVGGTLNAVAGGGSFLTFPALLLTGVASVPANATSTVALWPGSVASVGAYRREIGKAPHVRLLSAVSLVGGLGGALLLLRLPSSTFSHLVPYLLLAATVLFAVSGPVTRRLRARVGNKDAVAATSWRGLVGLGLAQGIIALYGGFFGGGIGILMLATLGLMGLDDIHVMNGLKTVLASVINGIAVVTFIIAGAVVWSHALVMLAGAIIGGYAGAAGARHVDPRLIRAFVILVGTVMTIYFFVRQHGL